jgi:acyl carrier protein
MEALLKIAKFKIMGLDAIELIIEIEQKFGINIPDEEAEKITTVGKMYDAVWSHLGEKHTDKCKSQILFYTIRKHFEELFQLPRQECKLDTLTNSIFPEINRRKIYEEFSSVSKLILPELALTKFWGIFLNAIGLITILASLILAIVLVYFYDLSYWYFLYPIIGIFITSFISKLLTPKRIIIKQKTVRTFTEEILKLNYSKISKDGAHNRKEVESVINQIIIDKIGVNLDEISLEKSFTDDLGVD